MTQYITVAADDHAEAKNGIIKLHGPEGFEGMRRAELVHRRGNSAHVVRDDPHLGETDTVLIEPFGDLGDIPVLSPSRQDLVADDDKRRGPGPAHRASAALRRCSFSAGHTSALL